jgi:predicted peroxiredoxin
MSNSKIISFFFLLVLFICSISTCQKEQAPMKDPVRDGIFIHISNGTNDPHRVLMALNMAAIMAEDKDVLVYFDIKGVEVVLKDSPDLVLSHFPSSKTQLQNLMEKDVSLYVCPGCLKAAGKNEADVMDGVKIAEKQAFFNFTKGRILSLDY